MFLTNDPTFTMITGKEEIDLDYLRKLARSINGLLDLEEVEEEDSLKLNDARTDVKRRLKMACIDFKISTEFVDSYIKSRTN
ncbi:hypothetical protein H6G54_02675 [Anabaena cylindrica FACHB-243]|uniref:Uncharacterized protein n=1 Tax=Anabaena cylindrica (strain ATCC 27899 / PCC 7122) TaxID=272123 RepID=K9ZPZ8_ANACC|nr:MULTISPECIES: hypothetical protein [Anabaena]AFZ61293.1 hypothetical protein Anacy_6015 [Anabaena cylindrica PCC 7122]MBD2416631.1 hypothetical protein [Anabaena cylindrica FACHB-243]MBY5284496.1 hypothetical protein [Anabaena sp. CCAP 1446/1C]MBY5306756.1 hypothetical protein [Anabaena sp. CCAP 1446/1C]MCM2410083.1 hypothetical protein [Anabaena sp. CCAP 1446/1C]